MGGVGFILGGARYKCIQRVGSCQFRPNFKCLGFTIPIHIYAFSTPNFICFVQFSKNAPSKNMISLIKIYNGNMFQLHKRDANKILNKNVFLLYILIKEIVFNLCIEFVFLLYIEFAPPNSAKIRFR